MLQSVLSGFQRLPLVIVYCLRIDTEDNTVRFLALDLLLGNSNGSCDSRNKTTARPHLSVDTNRTKQQRQD